MSVPIIQASVDSCFFPLYEVEHGITTINYDRRRRGKRSRHRVAEAHGEDEAHAEARLQTELDRFQAEVDRRWVRLKEMHKNPLL